MKKILKMKKCFRYLSFVIISIFGILAIISSGGGGGGGSDPVGDVSGVDEGGTETQGSGSEIVGLAQKGPFILGSDITIQELDESLNSTGTQFITEIINNLGEFTISPNLTSQFVEVIGDGYYYDEVTGDLSAGTLNLWTISDLESGTEININVLTYIEKTRLKTLISEGKSFDEARTQAKAEVLAAFNISEDDISDFDKMDISESGSSNAILLAVSSILLQMAHDTAAGESNVSAELSEILSSIAAEIGADGSLDDYETQEDLCRASLNLDQGAVRSNLESRYSELGADAVIPSFEDYIDTDCYLEVLEKGLYPQIAIDTIEIGNPLGIAILSSGEYAYLAGFEAVYVIQISSNSVIGSISIEGNLTDIAISPDDNYAYVLEAFSQSVYVIQTSDNSVIETISGFDESSRIDKIAITPDGNYAYVTDHHNVFVIQTSDNTLIDRIDIAVESALDTMDIVITPDGSYVYVTDSRTEEVHVIRVSDNTVVDTISVTQPKGITITPDGSYLYVSGADAEGDQLIAVIQTSDYTTVAWIMMDDASPQRLSITPDGQYVYVNTGGSIYIFETASQTIIDSIETDCSSSTAHTPDGNYVYVACGEPEDSKVICLW
jgi:YVTN family beta-propeller protein